MQQRYYLSNKQKQAGLKLKMELSGKEIPFSFCAGKLFLSRPYWHTAGYYCTSWRVCFLPLFYSFAFL